MPRLGARRSRRRRARSGQGFPSPVRRPWSRRPPAAGRGSAQSSGVGAAIGGCGGTVCWPASGIDMRRVSWSVWSAVETITTRTGSGSSGSSVSSASSLVAAGWSGDSVSATWPVCASGSGSAALAWAGSEASSAGHGVDSLLGLVCLVVAVVAGGECWIGGVGLGLVGADPGVDSAAGGIAGGLLLFGRHGGWGVFGDVPVRPAVRIGLVVRLALLALLLRLLQQPPRRRLVRVAGTVLR